MTQQEEKTSNDVFAENLRLAISAKAWTQGHLADASGISQGTISNYVRGKREPTGSQLRLLARALEVRMEWLLTGDGRQTNDAMIAGVEEFTGEKYPDEVKERMKRALDLVANRRAESRDEQRIETMEEKLDEAAKIADLLSKRLQDAETELQRLRELLKRTR